MNIKVDDTYSMLIGEEFVYVKNYKKLCEDSLDKMQPSRAVNAFEVHLCGVCKGLVPSYDVDKYNQHFGYSGYDEVYDES